MTLDTGARILIFPSGGEDKTTKGEQRQWLIWQLKNVNPVKEMFLR